MRIMILLCTIWLTGCTYTRETRATYFQGGEESRAHRRVIEAYGEPWVSVSAWVISYPADQNFISTRELAGDRPTLAFQQYAYFQFETEGYSFVSPEQASEILAIADKLDAVQFVEMPRLNVLVNNSGSTMVGSLPGFGVWLRTLTATGSSATIEYRVRELGHPYTTRNDQKTEWEMSGEAELELGVCYLRTIATDDPHLKVAVLLCLVSVSHPNKKANTEA